ncbi:MAG: hypothetical protein CL535_15010 [Ahrensia sp.]|nr:hypothetical protein [Ahrensia sp.]|tara:strand:+ start:7720 stop:7929 length:210 start_codon:yes stop_codon:yes gene_type:complete
MYLKRNEKMSVEEVAELFSVSVRTIRRWQAKGLLPETRYRTGRQALYAKADILRIAAELGNDTNGNDAP